MDQDLEKCIAKAEVSDINEIINLYRIVYGKKYPIKYGTDPDLLKKAILNEKSHLVLVGRDPDKNVVTGVLITEIDLDNKIGKLLGLVVHPDYQKNKIGNALVVYVSKYFLEENNLINSLYATTRTNTVGPQRVFIKNGYTPLGIFPNSHRLTQYETMTLFAKFRTGVLENRKANFEVSESLIPIYTILSKLSPNILIPKVTSDTQSINFKDVENQAWEYEIIRAPKYVYRKFLEMFPEAQDRFFPFHSPNMLISDKKGRLDLFAHFSKRDGYCTLIKGTGELTEITGGLSSLYMTLDDIGVSYIEVLVDVEKIEIIETLISAQFVPSALYPAFREIDGVCKDYIVMSRTMEPLNFRGMAVISHFKPFIDLYVDTWKQVNLDSIEVIYGPK